MADGADDARPRASRRVVVQLNTTGRALTSRLPDAHGRRVRAGGRRMARRLGLASTPVFPMAEDGRSGTVDAWVAAAPPAFLDSNDPSPDHALCPICGTTAESFLSYGIKAATPDRLCPGCGSLERHRLVWLYFALRTDLLDGGDRFLHVAPEAVMQLRLERIPGLDYLTGDLLRGKAMVEMDITQIDYPDRSFDVIYASHVLEHIPDDVLAMSELRRVLAPEGWAVLEVPMHGPATREDLTVADPAERNALFGQHDHVRMYGHDGEFERRLRLAGFEVTVVDLADELGPEAVRRHRLRSYERVYVCTVPT